MNIESEAKRERANWRRQIRQDADDAAQERAIIMARLSAHECHARQLSPVKRQRYQPKDLTKMSNRDAALEVQRVIAYLNKRGMYHG